MILSNNKDNNRMFPLRFIFNNNRIHCSRDIKFIRFTTKLSSNASYSWNSSLSNNFLTAARWFLLMVNPNFLIKNLIIDHSSKNIGFIWKSPTNETTCGCFAFTIIVSKQQLIHWNEIDGIKGFTLYNSIQKERNLMYFA